MYVEEGALFKRALCERAHMSSPYSVTFGVVVHGNCRTAMQIMPQCHAWKGGGSREQERTFIWTMPDTQYSLALMAAKQNLI